jgi:hypothetical protein
VISENGNFPAARQTFEGFLGGLWATACEALEVEPAQAIHTGRTLCALLPSWRSERIGPEPARQSYVADDGFPAEMSVNWSRHHPELRLLFDSLGDQRVFYDHPGDPIATHLQELIHDIFTPHSGRPTPAPLWHAVAWRPPAPLVHKTYFGIYEWPAEERIAAIDEAMTRLGLAGAWRDAHDQITAATGQHELEFFAVDLLDRNDARVKIYYRHHHGDLDTVRRAAAVAAKHDDIAADAAYQILTGSPTDAGREALTCLAFRTGVDTAAESTTYLRLPSLTRTDQEAVDRTSALLDDQGVDPGPFRALSASLNPHPLSATSGLLELVSFRAAGPPADVTTYYRFPVYTSQTLDEAVGKTPEKGSQP